ncbi:LmbE family N-acetylglucosaminyl deacetylase [Actinophytocola algeriensis]|uniref:LmbE family N-acetylglucosaminyl deacetylase n=2 Tax=Actinophytocola algeriensis TaxID=1768010 RepID=A0A7W7QAN8_9PSEU|nr:LmbE family N-acetylglucosaminyl deacetylase [Actinophytocola algeriensis]MBE1475953.1 LmbE family N-acetylglucosaminyl deacetylase [Actinophytocola algeriensis]
MKIMTIFAHPADTITNCGGTLARHADRGDEIVALILTHGGRIHANSWVEEWRKDEPDQAVTSAGLAEVVANKKAELARAAEIVGIGRVITLDHDDARCTVDEDIVDQIAAHVADFAPDVVIMDYPKNPVVPDSHTTASVMALNGVNRAATYLRNLDGRDEFWVKQIFFAGLPVTVTEVLSLHGIRNDTYVDITPVVGRKVAAMDQFVSQAYDGLFARKLIESWNGECGRAAGVNFAEAFCRYYNETHPHLPVTDHALAVDPVTRHVEYSRVGLRAEYPC